MPTLFIAIWHRIWELSVLEFPSENVTVKKKAIKITLYQKSKAVTHLVTKHSVKDFVQLFYKYLR